MNKYMSLESTIRSLGAKSASQPLEKDMNDQVHAGSYTSKNFEVSKPAQKLFANLPKHIDSDDAEESLKLHDKLFDIHKKVKASGHASSADIDTARRLHDQILKIGRDMGIEDKHGHVKDSLDFIKSKFEDDGKAKDDISPDDVAKRFATPPKDYQSDVKSDSDIDNLAKFHISRDKRAQRKLKIIDDEFKPGEQPMGKISDAMQQVLANEQEVNEKKLIGNQKKLDKNHNGKLDADDFKKLRKEDAERIDEVHAYSVKLKNGLSKASSGKTWWHTTEEGARKRNEHSHGGEGKVVKVKLEPDEYAYNGRAVKEEVEQTDESVAMALMGAAAGAGIGSGIGAALTSFKYGKSKRSIADRLNDTKDKKSYNKYRVSQADKSLKRATKPKTIDRLNKEKKDASDTLKKTSYLKSLSWKEEVETLDEAQFVFITKGSERKRIRNNPIEIARARKEGWAITEETEVVEANALKAVGAQQKKAIIQREVQQKKAMFAKKDAVDKQKFGKAMQKIHAGDEVEMDKKKIFMERAVAILGEEYAELSFEQLVEEVKKARGRPRKHPPKDPNAPKRPRGRPKKGASPATAAKPGAAKAEDGDKDREHIVMALRKAISLRGQHHVKFASGESHQISAEHAQKALKIHDSLSKPSEKMVYQRKLAASHDSFKKALADKSPGSDDKKKTGITLAKRAD